MMGKIKRAGYSEINGKRHWWTNWDLDELQIDYDMFTIECYLVPDDWLSDLLNERHFPCLMPMPMETLN